jgi:dihydroorotase
MKLIIKNVTVIDASSSSNGKTVDIFIEEGLIKKIGKSISEKDATLIEGKGNFISPGWCDMRANFCEPGYEYKEDLASGMKAAAAGGFTAVAITPETKPVLHSKAQIEFIKSKTWNELVEVLPYGAITHDLDGKNMAEMFDMKNSGAVAFSDGNNTIADAGVMLRALLYVKNFDGLIVSHADDIDISHNGKMNEGIMSVMLGMKSIPAIAEELIIARDIELLKYTGSRIHFSHISTKGSVKLIADAKAQGLNITCDVAIANLVYADSMLMEFDTNFKVSPPLRTQDDIDALIAGINNGTIDAIISDHRPQDDEHKVVEFDNASNGMNTLQTFYNLLLMLDGKIVWEKLIEVISTNPRKILGLPAISLKEGAAANYTIFNPEMEWEYDATSNLSGSKNSPLYGTGLKGKVVGVGRGGKGSG